MALLRRRLALLAVLASVALGGAAVSGCGAVGHAVGGIVVHHLVNRFVHTPAGLRRVNKLFCLYHGHRILVDLRHHSVLGTSINFYEAYHSCKAGFGHG